MKLNFAELDTFIEENSRRPGARAGMTFGPVKVWFRIAARGMNGSHGLTIDIADITVEESERRKGAFRSLLVHVEALALRHGLAVYVQSIQNEHVITELKRRAYSFIHEELGTDAWLSPSPRKSHDLNETTAPSP